MKKLLLVGLSVLALAACSDDSKPSEREVIGAINEAAASNVGVIITEVTKTNGMVITEGRFAGGYVADFTAVAVFNECGYSGIAKCSNGKCDAAFKSFSPVLISQADKCPAPGEYGSTVWPYLYGVGYELKIEGKAGFVKTENGWIMESLRAE